MTDIIDAEVVDESQALVRVDMGSYVPELRRKPAEVKALIEEVEELVHEHLRPGVDYMTIPGTPKPCLLQPGAERVNRFFGFGSTVELVSSTEDWDKGFVNYVYRVGVGPITERGIVPIAFKEASCNNKESKYARQNVYTVANTIRQMSEKRAFIAATRAASSPKTRT